MADNLGDISGIGPSTLDTLHDFGIESIDDLARSDPDDMDFSDVRMSQSAFSKLQDKGKKNTIMIQTGSEVVEEYENRRDVSTGVPELDDALGGGLEAQTVVAVGGGTGSGKTQLAFQLAGQAVEDTDKPAIYIETEPDRYRGGRIQQMYDESIQSMVYKIPVKEPNALDKQYSAYQKIKEEFDEVGIVIVDSFTSRFRMEEDFTGRSNYGERADEFRRHLNELERMAQDVNAPVVLNCQIYSNPGQYGKGTVIYGSTLMMHTVNFVMLMSGRSGALTNVQIENHAEVDDFEMLLQITDGGLQFAD